MVEIVHFPTPTVGPGSTLLTVIGGLVDEGNRRGRPSSLLVEPWRAERLASTRVRAAERPRFPDGRLLAPALLADHAAGRVTGRRPFGEHLFTSAWPAGSVPAEADVVLHDGSFAVAGVRPCRRAAAAGRLVFYAHIPVGRHVGRRELRRRLEQCDRVICVSQFLADDMVRRLGGGRVQVDVVPNGVDTEVFSPGPGGLADGNTIVWVGQASPEKGAHHLLQALRLLMHRDWTLRVVGASWFAPGGSLSAYESELRALAAPLAGRVEFVGYVPHVEMPGLLRESRIFCFPSTWDEPFGLGLLEAMSCGLACVASPRGGIPEFAGEAVRWAEPDPRTLAAAIDGLLEDRVEAERLGLEARRRASRYSLAEQFTRFDRVLTGVPRAGVGPTPEPSDPRRTA